MQPLNLTGINRRAASVLKTFAEEINAIQPDFFKGLYLTGSIPLNDFQPDKSDIDFIVVCRLLPNKSLHEKLTKVHRQLLKQFPKPVLNGYYLSFEDLKSINPEAIQVLNYHEGILKRSLFDMAPVALYELKTTANAVYGQPASELTIAITVQALHSFLNNNINGYWQRWINKHSGAGFGYALLICIPQLTEWLVLGVARQLYSLQQRKIVSKTFAGEHVLAQLPVHCQSVVKQALAIIRRQKPSFSSCSFSPSVKRSNEALACGQFIINQFNQTFEQQYGR